jgi:SAM-dependent methyltransferase
VFDELCGCDHVGHWRLQRGPEAGMLIARRDGDGCTLWVLQGFQVVTAEGLEVLALATTVRPVDGAPLADTVDGVRSGGGIPVLPWGFGKWMGRRGRALAAYLEQASPSAVCLGDNGGRPRFWPTPRQLRRWTAPDPSAGAGSCLPGSDPLPLVDGVGRVGSYGVEWRQPLAKRQPLTDLKAALSSPSTGLRVFAPVGGGRVGTARFVRDQLALRLNKLRGAGKEALEHDTRTPDLHTASADYARRFAGPIGAYLLEVQEQATDALLPPSPDPAATRPRALDVGGGHGQLTALLLRRGYDVWVQGSRPAWAERLLELKARNPDRVHLVVADLWQLPFADRSFDLVLGFRLLAHVEATEPLVREMARVSRDVVVADYAPLWSANLLEPLLFRIKRLLEGNTRPYFCYTAAQLRRWLGAAGFSGFQQARQFWLPMVIHRKLDAPARSARLEALGRRLGLTALIGAPVVFLARRQTP